MREAARGKHVRLDGRLKSRPLSPPDGTAHPDPMVLVHPERQFGRPRSREKKDCRNWNHDDQQNDTTCFEKAGTMTLRC